MGTATKAIPNPNVKETQMNTPRLVIALVAIASGSAFAQSAANEFVERNVNQQQRIEQGLQSGQLTTREASRLEREEGRVERMESKAMQDGRVTPNEAHRIGQAQNNVSHDIYREKHDTQTGNPNSPSSQRMQHDVQRNINQQQRIGRGLQTGSLTPREAGRMERGEARINRMEGRAGGDGHVGRFEQQRIQHAENRQSGRIYQQKHDGQQRGGGNGARRGAQGNNGNHFGQQSHNGNDGGANNGSHIGQLSNAGGHANQHQGIGRPSMARR